MPWYLFACDGHGVPADQEPAWFPSEVDALIAASEAAAEMARNQKPGQAPAVLTVRVPDRSLASDRTCGFSDTLPGISTGEAPAVLTIRVPDRTRSSDRTRRLSDPLRAVTGSGPEPAGPRCPRDELRSRPSNKGVPMLDNFWESLRVLEEERAHFSKYEAAACSQVLAIATDTRKAIASSRDLMRRVDQILNRDLGRERPAAREGRLRRRAV